METMELWPWLTQVVPWIIGGAGITGLLTVFLEGRRDHHRWLRDQKARAYADVYLSAQQLVVAIENLDRDVQRRNDLIASFGFEQAAAAEQLAQQDGPEETGSPGSLTAEDAAERRFLKEMEAIRLYVAAGREGVSEAGARLTAQMGTVGLFAPATVEDHVSTLLSDVSDVQLATSQNWDPRGESRTPQVDAALATLQMTRSLQALQQVLRKDLNVRG